MKKRLLVSVLMFFLTCFSIGIGMCFLPNLQNDEAGAWEEKFTLNINIYYYQYSSGGSAKQGIYTSPSDGSTTEAGEIIISRIMGAHSNDLPDNHSSNVSKKINASERSISLEAMVAQSVNLVDHWVEYKVQASGYAKTGFSVDESNNSHTVSLHTYKSGQKNKYTTETATISFRPISYQDTYNSNGGTFSNNATTKTSNTDYFSSYNVPEIPTRQGYVFDGWWTAATDGSRVSGIKRTAGEQTLYAHWTAADWSYYAIEPTGTGAQTNPYLISSAEELAWIAKEANNKNNFTDKYFMQTADIDLGGRKWFPIGTTAETSFYGKYDGQNYEISNISVDRGTIPHAGLFGYVNRTILQNIRLVSGSVRGGDQTGGIIGRSYQTNVINCYNNAMVTGTQKLGGIVGCSRTDEELIKLTDCINAGKIVGTGDFIGGITGQAEMQIEITNCTNYGQISSSSHYLGGIIGYSNKDSIIEICENYGAILPTGNSGSIGGICGWASDTQIINSNNYAEVKTNYFYTGGIVGRPDCVNGPIYVNTCLNEGDITGINYVGGIVGDSTDSGVVEVDSCINKGKVIGENGSGGIIGRCGKGTISDNVNYGVVIGKEYTGGIVGHALSSTVSRNTNYADVTGDSWTGGVIGEVSTGSVDWCLNYGTVSCTITDVGGLIGRVIYNVDVSYCINEGKVIGKYVVGGLIGSLNVGVETVKNCYAYCEIESGDNSDFSAGGIIGCPGDQNQKVQNCFYVGTATGKVNPLYGTKWNVKPNMENCYGVVNSTKYYTKGGFDSYQIISGVNQSYPVMQELFSIAREPNGSAVLQFFRNNGFSLFN